MAELEKIRSWRWILIAFIALGMVGFLIPYDAVLAMFGQGANREVGQIGSTSISIVQYQQELQDRQGLFNYQTQTGLKNEVWNDLIERSLLTPEYEEIGLSVNQEEFDEIRFGEHETTTKKAFCNTRRPRLRVLRSWGSPAKQSNMRMVEV